MRKLTPSLCLLVLIMIALAALGPAAAQGNDPRGDVAEPTHLVLALAEDGQARINRMDWDVNAFAPVSVGLSVRSSDYLELAGRTTLLILCTDLTVLDQRGSEVPRCDTYARTTAFYYADDPAWSMDGQTPTIVSLPPDLARIPEGVNPAAYPTQPLSGGALEALLAQAGTIAALPIAPEAQIFALASLYRGQGLIFEALSALLTLPDLQCSARRPTVDVRAAANPFAASPVTYLRLGELYDILNLPEDALRSYRCAADLAVALGDKATAALAFARQANREPDPVRATALYQEAINAFAELGGQSQATTMLEICGLRNCTMP